VGDGGLSWDEWGDGWPAMGLVAKLVARLFVTASALGFNPDISQKIIYERHKQWNGKYTISRQKILLNPSYS